MARGVEEGVPVEIEGHGLGRLEPVETRTVWANEAHDFTPWLLSHPEDLGEVLGMDLQLTEAEHAVGGFSLTWSVSTGLRVSG